MSTAFPRGPVVDRIWFYFSEYDGLDLTLWPGSCCDSVSTKIYTVDGRSEPEDCFFFCTPLTTLWAVISDTGTVGKSALKRYIGSAWLWRPEKQEMLQEYWKLMNATVQVVWFTLVQMEIVQCEIQGMTKKGCYYYRHWTEKSGRYFWEMFKWNGNIINLLCSNQRVCNKNVKRICS